MQDFGMNQALVEELFLQYCSNPASVSDSWRTYFDALPPSDLPELTSAGNLPAATVPQGANGVHSTGNGAASAGGPGLAGDDWIPPSVETPMPSDMERGRRESFAPTSTVLAANELQGRVSAVINAYRAQGHLFAKLDPLNLENGAEQDHLEENYGLAQVDPETLFAVGDLAPTSIPLREILHRLRETYCRSIGVEYSFIEDPEIRRWLRQRMESTLNRVELTEAEQLRILSKLTDAEIFEDFLHTNYVGAKRFSLEGAESFIPLVDLLIDHSADQGVQEVVMGMAHRGRLNVLANIFDKKLHEIFAGFEDNAPEEHIGRGDVKYHMGYSSDRTTQGGNEVHLTLAFNPSHLEFVAPVVEGRVRAKQDRRGDTEGKSVLPLIVHGDSAFAGQGIVTETLNLWGLEGYRTGGTIHVVINNQVGFTTMPCDSRSTRYCTDIARMLRCPVFHVNGEDPEAVAQVARLATEFRQYFGQDVIVDLFCYRKYGHNEGDEPRFTQPVMYGAVDKKRTVREVFVEKLVSTGEISEAQAEEIEKRRRVELEAALQETRSGDYSESVNTMQGHWKKYQGGPDERVADVSTNVSQEQLQTLMTEACAIPDGFEPHPKIARLFKQRIAAVTEDKPLDWGMAETLAYASLVSEGTRVRISGQDARRGTFSHRHAAVYDRNTGDRFLPMQHMGPEVDGHGSEELFSVYDSPLSEAGVLGFDFGYSLDSPDALCIWEAQFGDFANGAQVLIDQFICSSEDKWHRLCGLTLLLPHGFEGQGPEHSSARLERFLAQCAEDNTQVCNLTTPAQIFHALRRQVVRPWRKPLVIMSPKSLLRHPRAKSSIAELSEGGFQRIIGDTEVNAKKARRVVLCSGKVYYDLVAEREKKGVDDVAIVRMEQLYPIRPKELQTLVAGYNENVDLVWLQEEPWNMGAWFYMHARLPSILGRSIRCISRPESASPATGSKGAHGIEQQQLMDEAFE